MYKHFFKRLFDIIGALIILPFVLLEIIILAPFIWLTDRGPVFYNAYRAGKNYCTDGIVLMFHIRFPLYGGILRKPRCA